MRIPAALALALAAPVALPAHAEVTRFEVLAIVRPAFEGRAFGAAGTYERITARATIAIDPADPRNGVIVDLDRAPRNAAGRVEAVDDVVVLRPADPARAHGTLLLEAPNRGNKPIGPLFEDAPNAAFNRLERAADAGPRGFLFAQGATLAWVGWQADLPAEPGRMRVQVRTLTGVTGRSREEFVFDHARSLATVPLTYPAAEPPDAAPTVRARAEDPRRQPSGLTLRFLDTSRIEITRPPEGFDAGAIYELIYTARDPTVAGLGFAAFRDVASFLKHEGSPANPLATDGRPPVARVYGFGVSQSGRFLRDLLYRGFTEDERGRAALDALWPHIPGTRRSFTNARFAQPGRNPSPHADRLYPADQFPFTYEITEDPLTGARDGLLRRCRASRTATADRPRRGRGAGTPEPRAL